MSELPDGKRPVGRPSSYQDHYPGLLIEHMREGGSFWSFAAVVGVSMQTLNVWLDKHDEFVEARQIGKALELQFWENVAMKTATGQMDGNPTLIIWNQKNKFPKIYKERPGTQKVQSQVQLQHIAAIQSLVAGLPPEQLLMMANVIADKMAQDPKALEAPKDEKKG